jgi:uncharacterized protein YodC (DUF2158 family)
MADFRIWGKVEQFGPEAFFVVVSAVPDPPVAGAGRFMVDTGVVDLSDQATRDGSKRLVQESWPMRVMHALVRSRLIPLLRFVREVEGFAMASRKKWKSGDIVYLASPNPNVYVDSASPRLKVDWYTGPSEVRCSWLGLKGEETRSFHEDSLEASSPGNTSSSGASSAREPGRRLRALTAAAARFLRQR